MITKIRQEMNVSNDLWIIRLQYGNFSFFFLSVYGEEFILVDRQVKLLFLKFQLFAAP